MIQQRHREELQKEIDKLKAEQQAKQNKPVVKIANAVVPQAQASSGDNYSLVTKWATHYGIDPVWMHRVVKCESNYRSNAVNGTYWSGGSTPTGIAQFLASTYIANAKRIGLPAQDDRLNPDRSLQVMAWMFSIGQWKQWECR